MHTCTSCVPSLHRKELPQSQLSSRSMEIGRPFIQRKHGTHLTYHGLEERIDVRNGLWVNANDGFTSGLFFNVSFVILGYCVFAVLSIRLFY